MGANAAAAVSTDGLVNNFRRPAAVLAGKVEWLWHSVGPIDDPRERVLPDGTFGLVLALGADHCFVEPTGLQRIPAASFGGLQSRPFVLHHPPRCDVLGIVLKPAGAYALLRRPLGELTDRTVDLHDLIGRAAGELIDRCREAPTATARFALVTDWLAHRMAAPPAPHPAPVIAWIAEQIETHAGTTPVGELRDEAGVSKTRLAEGFRTHVGVRPKLYARLMRFRRALKRLQRGEGTLAEIAADTGYYDQAHMNADFRELGGLSPLEFVAACYPEGIGNTAREPER